MTDPSGLAFPRRSPEDLTHTVIIMGDNALNDTGVVTFSDGTQANLSTPPALYPGQDARFGRDAQSEPDDDGHAGFSFTKLDSDGNPMASNAPSWSCTRDNVTGLVWENKSADKSLSNSDPEASVRVNGREFRAGNFVYGWRKKEDSNHTGGSLGVVENRETQLTSPPISPRGHCGYEANSGRRDNMYCNSRSYVQEMNRKGGLRVQGLAPS